MNNLSRLVANLLHPTLDGRSAHLFLAGSYSPNCCIHLNTFLNAVFYQLKFWQLLKKDLFYLWNELYFINNSIVTAWLLFRFFFIAQQKAWNIYLLLDPLLVESTNPLLLRLKQKLCDEFNENPTSRCIIFVKTRDIVRGLLSYLSQDQTLEKYKLNPKQLTGAGARRDNFGKFLLKKSTNFSCFSPNLHVYFVFCKNFFF